jgi:phosphate transport system substrate-binding protein
MNDDFLRRLRKAPPPEFLDGLKARLERQSPLARGRSSRLPFSRGLWVGLLLGSAAFAITSLSVNRTPASFEDFLRAPAQLLARMGGSSSQRDESQPRRGAPLGPVWLPKHVAPAEEPLTDSGSVAHIAPPGSNTALPAASGRATESDRVPTRTPLAATQTVGTPFFGFIVVAPPTTYPHAQAVAQHLGNRIVGMKVVRETGGATVNRLCSPDLKSGGAALAELPDRITPAQLRNCDFNLTELKVGHQAIVTARSRLYGPMSLSTRALFLALARQVPVPTDPTLLMDNPYTTWNQIDNTLPDDPIRFLGPDIGGVQGKLAAALLLTGCNTYPWIADLRSTDPARYDEICLNIRADGAYEAGAESSVTNAERLEREPTLLAVFTLSDFNSLQDRLAASVIDSVLPTPETVAADTYPNSRTLYLYTKQSSYAPNSQVGMVINAYVAPLSRYANAPGDWGFIPLNETEHADVAAILQRMHLRP